jgi:hypothetical protein
VPASTTKPEMWQLADAGGWGAEEFKGSVCAPRACTRQAPRHTNETVRKSAALPHLCAVSIAGFLKIEVTFSPLILQLRACSHSQFVSDCGSTGRQKARRLESVAVAADLHHRLQSPMEASPRRGWRKCLPCSVCVTRPATTGHQDTGWERGKSGSQPGRSHRVARRSEDWFPVLLP